MSGLMNWSKRHVVEMGWDMICTCLRSSSEQYAQVSQRHSVCVGIHAVLLKVTKWCGTGKLWPAAGKACARCVRWQAGNGVADQTVHADGSPRTLTASLHAGDLLSIMMTAFLNPWCFCNCHSRMQAAHCISSPDTHFALPWCCYASTEHGKHVSRWVPVKVGDLRFGQCCP